MVDKFEIDDEAFWSDPWITRKEIQCPMMQRGQEGFLIGAPKTVALNQHQTLPVAILRVSRAEGGAAVDFGRSAIVAAVDCNTYELNARLAFNERAPLKTRPKGRSGAKGDSFSGDATAMVSEGHTLDLATRLKLPLSRSEYLVAVICQDQVSNQCRMKIVESAGYQDPAVEEFLSASYARDLPPPRISPDPGPKLPNYRRLAQSPALPEGSGIALSVARVTAISPHAECVLHGSFRLPVRAHHLVDEPQAGDASASSERMTAIVPVTLLLTGSVVAAPILLPLHVPSYSPIEDTDAGSMMAKGYFALDLCAMAPLTATPQTNFVYAFGADVISDPALAAFVRKPVYRVGDTFGATHRQTSRP